MIGQTLGWWVASTVAGLAAFPLAWRILHRLPDRGWGLTRAVGLLLSGYLLWMGASAGIVRNNAAGATGALALVALAGLAAGWGHWNEIGRWLSANRRMVLAEEVVLAAAFGLWAFVRANNPEIIATEKPMELAFLNAILRSPQFPPSDPWLSGYAISYYYFGYVLLAMLTQWTGVTAGVAFNLGSALWFGLTAAGTYSLTLNLLAVHDGRPRLWASLLGPALVLLVGNAAGLLEIFHSLHLFWSPGPDGTLTSGFWQALNLQYLARPPSGPPVFPPNRHWWWWQGARVINDINLTSACPPDFLECSHVEVIDEFPFFSFLLADNHPHVLALPFVLLAVGFALQVYLSRRSGGLRLSNLRLPESWPTGLAVAAIASSLLVGLARGAIATSGGADFAGALTKALQGIFLVGAGWAVVGAALALASGRWESPLEVPEILFGAWVLGALAFLNTWDFPIYLALLLAGVGWNLRHLELRRWAALVAVAGGAIGLGAVLLYFPWLPTFASQAGGILPNLVFPTRLPQFLIFFATSLVPLSIWLALRVFADVPKENRRGILLWGLGLPLALLVVSWVLGLGVLLAAPEQVDAAVRSLSASSLRDVVQAALVRRAGGSWTAILVGLIAAAALVLLLQEGRQGAPRESDSRPGPFVLCLIGLGALLVMVPEFLYLKDSFGSRMNTVFKFYYAAWLVWGLAGAYLLAIPWPGKRGQGWAALSMIPLAVGFLYTGTALWNKTSGFQPGLGRSLDGTLHLATDSPADYAAIQWINASLPNGVVAEAVGGSYSQYGRISAHTGLVTVLGWDFHEIQWRGDAAPLGSRASDIERLYLTREWEEARTILDQYGIDFVYIGPLERGTYSPVQTRKFDIYMEKIYETDDVVLYARAGLMAP
ncbi:MAG: hypothetical protein A2Z17_00440 [Gammaproteobacteria bacterium RBG_16_66_13]|nr:MAG: hypothetical protein A2Z17_00440 [Gammaproteobacteria bacterium RBG_16_66_13]